MQINGQLGTHNFQEGTFDRYESINGEALAEKENIVNGGCLSCPVRCSRRVKVENKNVKGPELETLGLLGPNILNDDPGLVCKWNYEIDELGMDTISLAQTLSWAMQANEQGIWDSGLEFGKTDNISQIIDDIAHRRGVGNDLAEGSKRLSEKYGGTDFAMQVKGLEISAYHPANAVGQGLGYAIANRGACHLNGGYTISLEGLGLHIDPHTTRGKADLCMFMQNMMESISMNGQCLFTSFAVFPAFLVSKPNSPFDKDN
jgi:Aldehyde:ferredoxin oxidoreductase